MPKSVKTSKNYHAPMFLPTFAKVAKILGSHNNALKLWVTVYCSVGLPRWNRCLLSNDQLMVAMGVEANSSGNFRAALKLLLRLGLVERCKDKSLKIPDNLVTTKIPKPKDSELYEKSGFSGELVRKKNV